MKKILVTMMAVGLVASVSMADVFNVGGDVADTTIGLDAVGNKTLIWVNQTTLTAADDNYAASQGDKKAVLVFALPDLAGKGISAASLNFELQSRYPTADSYPAGLDLYGVRYASTAVVLGTDYDLVTSSLVQDDVATLANNNDATYASFTTVTASDAGLATWLTAQYTAGAVAGNFVYLRLESDVHMANPWNMVSADGASGTPVLTITTIPEPATLGLVTAFSGAILFIRRKFMI